MHLIRVSTVLLLCIFVRVVILLHSNKGGTTIRYKYSIMAANGLKFFLVKAMLIILFFHPVGGGSFSTPPPYQNHERGNIIIPVTSNTVSDPIKHNI
jgi:hypothetical protein